MGRQLDLQATPSAAHENGVVSERGFVQEQREALALAQGADTANHVTGSPLGVLGGGHVGVLGPCGTCQGLEVQFAGCWYHGHGQTSRTVVKRYYQGFENAGGIDTQRLRGLHGIGVGRRVVSIRMNHITDACLLCGVDGGSHSGCPLFRLHSAGACLPTRTFEN